MQVSSSTALVDVRATTRLRRLMRSAGDAEGIVVAAGSGVAQVTGAGLALVAHAAHAARRLRAFVNADEFVIEPDVMVGALVQSPRSFIRFLRQGVELVRAVQTSARDASDVAVDGFCEAWIEARTALIDQVADEPRRTPDLA